MSNPTNDFLIYVSAGALGAIGLGYVAIKKGLKDTERFLIEEAEKEPYENRLQFFRDKLKEAKEETLPVSIVARSAMPALRKASEKCLKINDYETFLKDYFHTD